MQFRQATINDLELLKYWDTKPHVIASDPDYEGYWEWETELAQDSDWRDMLIAEKEGEPIGFMQIMDPQGDPEKYWGEVEPGLRAIDIWIGEEENLGRGYGTTMMNMALERIFKDPTVRAVLVDPLTSNTRAQTFYKRFGFKFIEHRRFGQDDCSVYRLDRKDFTS